MITWIGKILAPKQIQNASCNLKKCYKTDLKIWMMLTGLGVQSQGQWNAASLSLVLSFLVLSCLWFLLLSCLLFFVLLRLCCSATVKPMTRICPGKSVSTVRKKGTVDCVLWWYCIPNDQRMTNNGGNDVCNCISVSWKSWGCFPRCWSGYHFHLLLRMTIWPVTGKDRSCESKAVVISSCYPRSSFAGISDRPNFVAVQNCDRDMIVSVWDKNEEFVCPRKSDSKWFNLNQTKPLIFCHVWLGNLLKTRESGLETYCIGIEPPIRYHHHIFT